jgi:hypothetical protein
MDKLRANLEQAQRKKTSENVWDAVTSVTNVLTRFRELVDKEALQLQVGPAGSLPRYIFEPYKLKTPEGKPIQTDHWDTHSDFVLKVIREATGLEVTWMGPGCDIYLEMPPKLSKSAASRAPGPAGRAPASAARSAPTVSPSAIDALACVAARDWAPISLSELSEPLGGTSGTTGTRPQTCVYGDAGLAHVASPGYMSPLPLDVFDPYRLGLPAPAGRPYDMYHVPHDHLLPLHLRGTVPKSKRLGDLKR